VSDSRLDPTGVSDPGGAAALLREEAAYHDLPRRIATAAARLAGADAAIYVVDVDGSALHLLAQSAGRFPGAIEAPLGIGPEIPLESLGALDAAIARAVPGASCEPLLLGDRALGAVVVSATPASSLGEFAAEAALALELGSGYTDAIHATRRRKRPEAAAEIQQNLLPPRLARVTGATLAGGVLPGYEVGGDFFDYADDAGGVWLTLADAVGKGNEAAALASLAVGALRSSRRSGARLEDATRAMHEAVRSGSPGSPFVTAVSAIWDTRTGRLRWITAGHPRPMVMSAEGVVTSLIDGVTRPLGVPGHGSAQAAAECVLPPGSRLVLYSDGIVEQPVGTGGERFGTEGLLAALREARALTPAGIVRRVQDAVIAVSGGRLRDDATLLVVARDRGA
jgi:serine phosphatase RsbU (regulator of sigma subunit)